MEIYLCINWFLFYKFLWFFFILKVDIMLEIYFVYVGILLDGYFN